MRTKPPSRSELPARTRGCTQLERHVRRTASTFSDRGNAAGYVRSCEAAVVHLSMWMSQANKRLADIDEALVAEFLDAPSSPLPLRDECASPEPACALHWATFWSCCAPPTPSRPSRRTRPPVGQELRRYDQYMAQVRGLAPKTREGALRLVEALLRKHFGDGAIRFEVITAEHVRRFFAAQAKNYKTPSSLGVVVSALRGYFRWRATLGDRTHALVGALAYPANWQLASLPKSLEPAEVEQLEAALGQSGPSMLRADAMVRCALDLGLRSGEVARLSLDDIDWDAGTITLRRTKGRREDVMPLPEATGRGHCRVPARRAAEDPHRMVFARHMTPRERPDRAGPRAQDHPPGLCARRAAAHALAPAAPHDGQPPAGRRLLAQGSGRCAAAPLAEHDADLRQARQRPPRRSGPALARQPAAATTGRAS